MREEKASNTAATADEQASGKATRKHDEEASVAAADELRSRRPRAVEHTQRRPRSSTRRRLRPPWPPPSSMR
jgi:hypothetical protein